MTKNFSEYAQRLLAGESVMMNFSPQVGRLEVNTPPPNGLRIVTPELARKFGLTQNTFVPSSKIDELEKQEKDRIEAEAAAADAEADRRQKQLDEQERVGSLRQKAEDDRKRADATITKGKQQSDQYLKNAMIGTGAAVGAAGLYGLYKLYKHLKNKKDKTPEEVQQMKDAKQQIITKRAAFSK